MERFKFPNSLRILSVFTALASVGLGVWIVHLIFNLPTSYRAQNWNLAWIGFDCWMLATLALTSWAMWKRRQFAIPGSIVSATLLLIDAWFDVVMSQGGDDFTLALLAALAFEIPLALILFRFSRRAIKRTIINAHEHAGIEIVSVSLLRTPLTLFED